MKPWLSVLWTVSALTVLAPLTAPTNAGTSGPTPVTDVATQAGLRPGPLQGPPVSHLPPAMPVTAATIDFESFDLLGNTFLDTPETLVFPNAGGTGVTVNVVGHDDVRIYDLIRFAGDYGTGRQACIDMNWVDFRNPLGTDIVFDLPVDIFSLIAGDYGSDDDSPLMITAFDVNGNVLGTDSASWPASAFPPFAMLTVTAPGIMRVHYSSGGSFPNSTFIDAFSFSRITVSTAGTTWGRLKSQYR